MKIEVTQKTTTMHCMSGMVKIPTVKTHVRMGSKVISAKIIFDSTDDIEQMKEMCRLLLKGGEKDRKQQIAEFIYENF